MKTLIQGWRDNICPTKEECDSVCRPTCAVERRCANELEVEMAAQLRIENALRGILGIGKRDMSNSKYDGYFNEARAAIERRP